MSVYGEDKELAASRNLVPLLGPVAVIESERTRPVGPAASAHARILVVTAGTSVTYTRTGRRQLVRGDVMVLGAGLWSVTIPRPRVRAWMIYLDANFLREQMAWILPKTVPLPHGTYPEEWDGRALFARAGGTALARLDPVLRRMSVLSERSDPVSRAALMAGFAHTVELTIDTVLPAGDVTPFADTSPLGPLTAPTPPPEVETAARLLREQMGRAWTVGELARAVALSRSQLTFRFTQHYGVGPMRFLTEARLTAFARLVEETPLAIGQAARRVGWTDQRVAATWFRRRYGLSPSEFRARPLAVGREPACAYCPEGSCPSRL